MRSINLLVYALCAKPLSKEEISMLTKVESQHLPDNLRKEEYNDLFSLIDFIGIQDFTFYDGFYFNYSIPHIGKEFDILRISDEMVVDIELKSLKGIEGITSQLKQNQMYLSFLQREVYCFTYEIQTNKLYYYLEGKAGLVEVDMLIDILSKQKDYYTGNLDDLFNPDHYLISPFNNPIQFMNHQYFLNQEQYTRKMEILEAFDTDEKQFIVLHGSSGSGKTLLLYDLCKQLENYYILHCSELSEGQLILKEHYHFHIEQIDHYSSIPYESLSYLIIDEIQKIDYEVLLDLISIVSKLPIQLLIAYDPMQILYIEYPSKPIISLLQQIQTLSLPLRGRVRGSKEINCFIEKLFDLKQHITYNYSHIRVVHFTSNLEADSFIHYMSTQYEYTYIPFQEVRKVLGKEFNSVIIRMDNEFYYDENGRLATNYKGNEHDHLSLLYESLTRAKTNLCIVVVKQIELYRILLHILN